MALVIRANTFLEKRSLKVDSNGVEIVETAGFGGRKRLAFEDIDYILMADGVLSLQYGNEVFSIQTRRDKKQHEQTIAALLQSVRGTLLPNTAETE